MVEGMKQNVDNIEEAPKLEWGPELGEMSWDDAQDKLVELNGRLKGKKPWRLPTIKELEKGMGEQFHWKKKLGFKSDISYWSSSGLNDSYIWFSVYTNGSLDSFNTTRDQKKLIRCVR